jgi:hypothetical protein
MNCPKCGSQTQPDQKFCRSCGAGLEMLTQRLASSATVSVLEGKPAIFLDDERQRAAGWMQWGMIILFMGVAIGVIGKMLMHAEIVTVVGVLVSLAGMFLTAYPFLLPSPRQRHDASLPTQPEALLQSQPPNYLQQRDNIEFVPSITERTTVLLEDSTATKPKPQEDTKSQA